MTIQLAITMDGVTTTTELHAVIVVRLRAEHPTLTAADLPYIVHVALVNVLVRSKGNVYEVRPDWRDDDELYTLLCDEAEQEAMEIHVDLSRLALLPLEPYWPHHPRTGQPINLAYRLARSYVESYRDALTIDAVCRLADAQLNDLPKFGPYRSATVRTALDAYTSAYQTAQSAES